jgi:hypothetical protein
MGSCSCQNFNRSQIQSLARVIWSRLRGHLAQLRFEQLRRRVVPFAEARSYLTYGGHVVKVFADKRCCLELTLFLFRRELCIEFFN